MKEVIVRELNHILRTFCDDLHFPEELRNSVRNQLTALIQEIDEDKITNGRAVISQVKKIQSETSDLRYVVVYKNLTAIEYIAGLWL